jgi:hypothetical protein
MDLAHGVHWSAHFGGTETLLKHKGHLGHGSLPGQVRGGGLAWYHGCPNPMVPTVGTLTLAHDPTREGST